MIKLEALAVQVGETPQNVLLLAAGIKDYREVSGQFTDGMEIVVKGKDIYLTNALAKLVRNKVHDEFSG